MSAIEARLSRLERHLPDENPLKELRVAEIKLLLLWIDAGDGLCDLEVVPEALRRELDELPVRDWDGWLKRWTAHVRQHPERYAARPD